MTDTDYETMLAGFLGPSGFAVFTAARDGKPHKGACFVPRRLQAETLAEDFPAARVLDPAGYFSYPFGSLVSDQPLYAGGAFYPLDYSAYCVAKALAGALATIPNPKVIDLCAAPGGKSIALSFLSPLGLLVANDIVFKRAQVLKTNLERTGVKQAIVTAADPVAFAPRLAGLFDAVILDAPCSGSGMARKSAKMAADWTPAKVVECTVLQRNLLKAAALLVRPGGLISYSTCSYSRAENEDMVAAFLAANPDFGPLAPAADGSLAGIGGLGQRYIPGLFPGEGQYSCLLRRKEAGPLAPWQPLPLTPVAGFPAIAGLDVAGRTCAVDFCDRRLLALGPLKVGYAVTTSERKPKCPYDWDFCHYDPTPFPAFVLSHDQALAFMRGEDLHCDTAGYDGVIAVAFYRGFPLAFARGVRGRLRNFLPAGLRLGN